MDRHTFINSHEVISFVNWAAQYLQNIQLNINISSAGTGRANGVLGPGVQGRLTGIDQVISRYHWRSTWHDENNNAVLSHDWQSTKDSLNRLSSWIQHEVHQRCNHRALLASIAIAKWGGDRAGFQAIPRGAIPFLQGIENLTMYLNATNEALCLEHADTANFDDILDLNSMLTKIHSLNASDGLPIYDSRVAAAIAALVEIYRQSLNDPCDEIPSSLRFKSVDRNTRRRVLGLNAQNLQFMHPILDPGIIDRGQDTRIKRRRASEWASSKVRLGWLLSGILDAADGTILSDDTPINQSTAAKMHALEAGLFMIGFDVSCIG